MPATRRLLAGLLLAGAAGVATACPPPPPPSSPKPTITAMTVSAPVVAGTPVEITVSATSVAVITRFAGNLVAPNGSIPWGTACTSEVVERSADDLQQTVRLTCPLPASMPNGVWTATVQVWSGGIAQQSTFFQVTGGTDDDDPPEVLSVTPLVRTTNSPVITIRVHDLNGARYTAAQAFQDGTQVVAPNAPISSVEVAPDVWDLTFRVDLAASGPVDLTVWISDDLGQTATTTFTLADGR